MAEDRKKYMREKVAEMRAYDKTLEAFEEPIRPPLPVSPKTILEMFEEFKYTYVVITHSEADFKKILEHPWLVPVCYRGLVPAVGDRRIFRAVMMSNLRPSQLMPHLIKNAVKLLRSLTGLAQAIHDVHCTKRGYEEIGEVGADRMLIHTSGYKRCGSVKDIFVPTNGTSKKERRSRMISLSDEARFARKDMLEEKREAKRLKALREYTQRDVDSQLIDN